MPRSAHKKLREAYFKSIAQQLRLIEVDNAAALNYSTSYLLHGSKDAFNAFLHLCTNYDDLLENLYDFEVPLVKSRLKTKAKELIRSI